MAGEVYQAGLIGDAYQGPFYLLVFHAKPFLWL